jgi:hypothetical protein
MSKVEAGQIGTFKGKTGQVVVASWRGALIGRKTPTKSNKPGSEEQKDQRSKFGLVTRFLRGLGDVINLGYQYQKTGPTPMNVAVQYNLENAVTGIYPNYALDFSKIMLSNPNGIGEIDTGFAPTAIPAAGAVVQVSWQVGSNAYKATSPDDRLSIIIYSVTKKKFIVYDRVVSRSALTYEVELPYLFRGDVCHGYMFFSSPKGKDVSLSEYLGQFTLLP